MPYPPRIVVAGNNFTRPEDQPPFTAIEICEEYVVIDDSLLPSAKALDPRFMPYPIVGLSFNYDKEKGSYVCDGVDDSDFYFELYRDNNGNTYSVSCIGKWQCVQKLTLC